MGSEESTAEQEATAEEVAPDTPLTPETAAEDDRASGPGRPGPSFARHSPFYKGFWGAVGVLLAVALGLILREVTSVIVLVVASLLLAVGLSPIVEWLVRHRIRRPWAVLLVTLGLFAFLALFVVALVPVLRDQITALIDNAPEWLSSLRNNNTIQRLDDKYDVIGTLTDKLRDPQLAQQLFGSVFTVGMAVFSALVKAFFVFVLTLYFLGSLPSIKRACYSLAPASRRARVTVLGDKVLGQVGGYVIGAFLVALCAGVCSFIFLEIVGLGEYALALALVVAILDLIPLVGATVGAVLVSVIALVNSLPVGIACIIFYVIYQQVENYFIYPRVMSSSVDIPGIVIVIAVLLGGTLLGVIGALLAIPIAASILLLLREVVIPRQDAH